MIYKFSLSDSDPNFQVSSNKLSTCSFKFLLLYQCQCSRSIKDRLQQLSTIALGVTMICDGSQEKSCYHYCERYSLQWVLIAGDNT